jgi:LPS-assembly protein
MVMVIQRENENCYIINAFNVKIKSAALISTRIYTIGLLMPFPRNIFFILTTSLIASSATAQNAPAQVEMVKTCPIPTYSRIISKTENIDSNAININSKSTNIKKDVLAKFSGGVTLINKDAAIIADEIEVNQVTSTMQAKGDIHFQNQGIDIFASHLSANEQSKTTELSNSSYQLANNPGHGSAGRISVNADGTLKLVDGNFTTCYGETPDWLVQASEINISVEENHGEVINAQFKLFDVPVFYLPYFSFPVTNERKSGFLYPKISSSGSSGLEIELPYYWNIAENMDATITPRYMSKRGTQLLTEFRYLSGNQNGEINIEYLNKDNELKSNDDPRYLARIQHVGNFSDNYRAYIDYTTISDDNYLVDIDSEQYNSNDAYLYQIAELAYFGNDWQAKIQLQDFEVLGDHKSSYKTVPHIELSSHQALPFLNGQFDIYSEITRFVSNDLTLPEADRYHVEAGLTFPISTPAWFLNSELKLLQTNYHQKRIGENSELEADVSRTLPKVRFHGGVNFDRQMTMFNSDFTQTLEPQIQYLYIPDEDQSNIGVYDTTTLQDDYSGLFRDKRFSGLDRIAQANQYSWGVTIRVLNPENQEIFRLSLGRIVYLNDSNLSSDNVNEQIEKSALATEVFLQINRKWQFSADIQFDTVNKATNKSQTKLDYYLNKNQTIQLNHRYTRNVSGIRIEQVSLLSNVILNENWQVVGRLTQDLQQKRSLESYLGMQYNSCCWGIRLSYHRHINSNLEEQNINNDNRDAFNSGFKIEFVYNGISGKRSSNSIADMFNSSIFGYKRPYFLNN